MVDDFDVYSWPAELRHLERLARHWSISDDEERSTAQERASDAELLNVFRTEEPHFVSIGDFLNSFEDGPDEDACVLGTLAECAAEIRFELERRGIELPQN